MMPTVVAEQPTVPPPAYHRAQVKLGSALHIDAYRLVRTPHLLVICRLAVRLAHRRCTPPLPAGTGGAPHIYSEESLLTLGRPYELGSSMSCWDREADKNRTFRA